MLTAITDSCENAFPVVTGLEEVPGQLRWTFADPPFFQCQALLSSAKPSFTRTTLNTFRPSHCCPSAWGTVKVQVRACSWPHLQSGQCQDHCLLIQHRLLTLLFGYSGCFFPLKNSGMAVYTDGNQTRRKTIPKNISGKSCSYPELITNN